MKISPTGKGSVQYGAKKYAQMDNGTDYGPPPGSATPVSPQNPNSKSLKRLTGCTVTLNGSMLDISNAEYSIALNLQPDQVEQMAQELSDDTEGGDDTASDPGLDSSNTGPIPSDFSPFKPYGG